MLEFEQSVKSEGYRWIIGIDEAGRGPLAGPVVASAVAVRHYNFESKIADSKKISPLQREKAFREIFEKSYVGVGIINETVIDDINILQATFMAMNNAVSQLIRSLDKEDEAHDHRTKTCLLIDGNRFKTDLPINYKTIVDGDAKVFSIACASIVAKVIRDRILMAYDRIYPEYGFKDHKGYGTLGHRQAISRHGFSAIHRKSFQCNDYGNDKN
ncbi:MAG: ribonuclease HII [Candidatus Omnitrophica bacterium]|nr:ribonuclease HII [Candidatus Omnitrophota bacterium]